MEQRKNKPLAWIGSSRRDLGDFPERIQKDVGHALWMVQQGEMPPDTKPLKGYKGAGVLEVISDWDGDTYRIVYTVRFAEVVFVLHAFQKKSKHGIATPKQELDLINARLKQAEATYQAYLASRKGARE